MRRCGILSFVARVLRPVGSCTPHHHPFPVVSYSRRISGHLLSCMRVALVTYNHVVTRLCNGPRRLHRYSVPGPNPMMSFLRACPRAPGHEGFATVTSTRNVCVFVLSIYNHAVTRLYDRQFSIHRCSIFRLHPTLFSCMPQRIHRTQWRRLVHGKSHTARIRASRQREILNLTESGRRKMY